LQSAWDRRGVTVETRKNIIRLLTSKIVVGVIGDTISVIIHWQGGDHTRLDGEKNKVGQTRWVTDISVIELVRVRHMADASIATVLNRSGKSTGRVNGWTRARVCSLRNHQEITPYTNGY
jgi:hypothetical protein